MYILGAMGSWLGFSFLMLNPVPLFLGIRGNAVNGENVNEQLIAIKNRLTVCEREKHSDRIEHLKEINQLKELIRVFDEKFQIMENNSTAP